MKKIININLSSRLIPIEDSAYEILRQYLDSLKRYFSQEDGADEIVSDIESRIAEIFQDKLRKGAHCITDVDVQDVKNSMGTPEQFEEDEKANTGNDSGKQHSQAQSEPFTAYTARPKKRYYRDPDNKILGGVCGGLGAYFNLDPLVFRIILALLAVGAFGTGIVVYFILWIATPEALTAAEKLEMRGERVDLNNIKNTVQEEMSAFKSRMEGVGNDVKNFSQGRGKQFGRDTGNFINTILIGLRNVLVFVTKGIFVFFAVVFLLALVVVLIGVAFFSKALLLKDLLLAEGMQSFLFWPTVVLLIGVPIISIIIFLMRRMTGIKQGNKYAGMTLGFMWILGIVFCVWLVSAVMADFSAPGLDKEAFYLKQPSTNKLIIRADEGLDMDISHMFESRLRVVEDTAIINNIHIKISRSETPQYQVEIWKHARGRIASEAKRTAMAINLQLVQQDSILLIPTGFAIPHNSDWRGQEVTIIIRVPVGKKIEIERNANDNFFFNSNYRRNDWNWDDFNENDRVELKMELNGLDNLSRQPVEEEEKEKPGPTDSVKPEAPEATPPVPNDNRYRYKPSAPKTDTVAYNTPVDNSGETAREDVRGRVVINGTSFLFSMYRAIAKQ